MEENQLPANNGTDEPAGCINCDSSHVEEGYPTRLCRDCRQSFIKYPIPLSIKLFAIGVGLVVLFALFSFPRNLSLGIHLEKGKKFEQKKQYLSAQHEFATVLKKVPDNQEANAHLMIAAFYNMDFETFSKAQEKLAGKNFDDQELLGRLNVLVESVYDYYPDTALANLIIKSGQQVADVPDTVYLNYLKENPRNIYGLYAYAGRLYNKDIVRCDSVLKLLVEIDVSYIPALRLLTGVQRSQEKWDESIQTCYKILEINKEAGYAYAAMARTYLKEKLNDLGLKMAKRSVETDKSDPYNRATLALAWHFNAQPAKRDAILNELKMQQDSASHYYWQYALDIIQQKEKL